MAAYQSRQNDPFYKMMDLKADFREENDAYVLTARIPEHEQQNLSASVKGDHLVISCNRRNEEQLETAPGHSVGSSSYQTFYETFPLSQSVDAHRLTREYRGDEVIIRVPKRNLYSQKPPEVKGPEKVRATPPAFPKNLPRIHSKTESSESPHPTPPKPGSGPLLT